MRAIALLVLAGCTATSGQEASIQPEIPQAARYVMQVAQGNDVRLQEDGAYDVRSGRFWRTITAADGPEVRFMSDGQTLFAQLPTGEWVGAPGSSPSTAFADLLRHPNSAVSVDHRNRVQRIRTELGNAVAVTLELSGYGEPVEVSSPSETSNTELLREAQVPPQG